MERRTFLKILGAIVIGGLGAITYELNKMPPSTEEIKKGKSEEPEKKASEEVKESKIKKEKKAETVKSSLIYTYVDPKSIQYPYGQTHNVTYEERSLFQQELKRYSGMNDTSTVDSFKLLSGKAKLILDSNYYALYEKLDNEQVIVHIIEKEDPENSYSKEDFRQATNELGLGKNEDLEKATERYVKTEKNIPLSSFADRLYRDIVKGPESTKDLELTENAFIGKPASGGADLLVPGIMVVAEKGISVAIEKGAYGQYAIEVRYADLSPDKLYMSSKLSGSSGSSLSASSGNSGSHPPGRRSGH